MPEVYETAEVCKYLHRNRKTVGLLRKYGILPARKIGRGYLTTKDELDHFLEETRNADLGNENKIILYAMETGRLKVS